MANQIVEFECYSYNYSVLCTVFDQCQHVIMKTIAREANE